MRAWQPLVHLRGLVSSCGLKRTRCGIVPPRVSPASVRFHVPLDTSEGVTCSRCLAFHAIDQARALRESSGGGIGGGRAGAGNTEPASSIARGGRTDMQAITEAQSRLKPKQAAHG